MKLTAYRIHAGTVSIRPAPVERAWMDATPERFAYRCLPLNIANAHGWELLCPRAFRATWNGDKAIDAVTIASEGEDRAGLPVSHFGSGMLTFHLPVLFRTEPGYDLMVQGPVNSPKDAIYPLQGIVETDWAPYTFTMNWVFTQPEIEVEFAQGEPFCHLFPVKRGEVEAFEPQILPLAADPELEARFNAWSESRRSFNTDLKAPGSPAQAARWQKHYYRGADAGTGHATAPDDHRTRLRPKDFREVEG